MALEICPRQPKRLRREQSEGSPSLFCWAIQGYAEPPDCDRVRKVKKSYSYFRDNLFWQHASPVFELEGTTGSEDLAAGSSRGQGPASQEGTEAPGPSLPTPMQNHSAMATEYNSLGKELCIFPNSD